MAAPTQFAYRSLKEIGIVDAAPVYESLPGFQRPQGHNRCCTYSPCGRYFAWASPTLVTIIDASVGHQIASLPAENVYEIGFSPRGTYVITWERLSKDEAGNTNKNLKVWRVLEEEGLAVQERLPLGKFVQKSQTGWNLQYTSDETYCARVVTNEVHFYESDNLASVWNKLRVEGVADFALSPGAKHSVAIFVPERKSMPASVQVYNVPQFATPVSEKKFYKGDKVQLKWNDLGTSIIVLAQTEVDKTGKSYYGETTLYILSAKGDFDSRIDLDKEGPIHDVTWSPNSKEFGVVYGSMPAKTTIFNARASATHSFPLGPRNTISFSPYGRFVLVAGFGNLAGQIDIYDLEKDYRKLTTIQSGSPSVCEWSPDGQYILTATTSPRLRVDNGVRIWHISGGLMYNEDHHELYHVLWRTQSGYPPPPNNPLQSLPTPHASALMYLGTVKTPSKPAGAYRPPGARGQATPLHFKREDEGGAAHVSNGVSSFPIRTNGFGKPQKREVPGSEAAFVEPVLPPGAAPGGGVSVVPPYPEADEALSKAALKNKKKREAKRARDAEKSQAAQEGQPSEVLAPQPQPALAGHSRARSRGNNAGDGRRSPTKRTQNRSSASTSSAAVPPPPVSEPQSDTTLSPGAGNPNEKKLRGLLKKMRAIEELRMRLAGGERLEETQMKKIGTEDGVRKELEALGWNG